MAKKVYKPQAQAYDNNKLYKEINMAVVDLRTGAPVEGLEVCPLPREPRLMTPDGIILDRPLPNHELSVVHRKKLWEATIDEVGHFKRELVTFNDGSQYEEQRAEPLVRRYDVGVTLTTPWCTRIPGLNTEMQKLLAMEGIASDLVGPPELPKGFLNTVHNLFHLDHLVENAHDAAAQLTLAQEASLDGLFSEEELMAMGYSRGGMIIWDLLGYAERFGFTIDFFDSNDPCLVVPLSTADIDLTDTDTYTYMARETMALINAIKNHSPRDLWNLAKTITGRPHPLQHAAVGHALFQGQAGWHMGSMPRQAVGAIRIYDQSIANQGETLKATLEPFQNMHFLDRTGLHTSGANPGVRRAAVGRVVLAQRFRQEGRPLDSVDWSKVTPLAA